MAVKVFVLGRPGSGKSTAIRMMCNIAQCRGWPVIRVNDFDILKEMFQADIHHERFLPAAHGGFDVIDFSVLDTALEEVERRVRDQMFGVGKKLITIEFARDDYSEALRLFSCVFLQDAYFLFIDAHIETCIQRIHRRVAYADEGCPKPDNHFVSDEIVRSYYAKNNTQYMMYGLREEYDINKWIKVIKNTSTLEEFKNEVLDFVNIIFWREEKLTFKNTGWPLLELSGSKKG